MNLNIVKYDKSFEDKWDYFVLNESVNGTFLQTRRFLNYHPAERFEDASFLILKGTNIVAVIPANSKKDGEESTLYSHMGSTFGGFVLGRSAYSISSLETIFPLVDNYLQNEGYRNVVMKSTADIFCHRPMALLDYEFFRYGYDQYNEIAFYLRCCDIPEDGMSMMTSSRRRDCKYSLKNSFRFERLTTDEQIKSFYLILKENLKKFNAAPVHSEKELLEFKNERLPDIVRFYGVYEDEELVAGTMLFDFMHKVLHTQYLACLPEYNKKFAMSFMDFNLIMLAKNERYESFSFGTSTGNQGKDLNTGLALYKEGFGCEYSVNRTYYRTIE